MALTINSKVKDLMANAEAVALIDELIPGLTTHPQIGIAKNFSLSKCAKILPDVLTPEIMAKIEDFLKHLEGNEGGDDDSETQQVAKKVIYDFDEIIDRTNTNSVKYDSASVVNPYLPDEFIPMWIADMDFAVPEPIRDAMKRRIDKKILGYSMPLDADYYLAVIDFMKRRHGREVNFDNIIFSAGVIEAMKVAVQEFTKEGDGILINTPAYHPFDDSVKKFNRKPVYCPLINNDGYYTFDFDDFEKKAKDKNNTMFFLCSPHNPSGRVWTEEELRRIGQICFDNDVFVFSDEIHSDITRLDQKHIPFAELFKDEKRLITATAPSKTFNIAGNQLSNIFIPDYDTAQKWRMDMLCGMPNPISIDACLSAYTECDDWLDQMRQYLDDNFKYVDYYLKKHLPKAKFRIPEGTYLCWIDMRAFNMSDLDLKKTISKSGLFIEYADEFVADGEGFVRMNVACPRQTLSRALKMLCESMGGTSEEIYQPKKKFDEYKHIGKLKINDTLPNFSVTSLKQDDECGLVSSSNGKKTAYIFLRYFGCTVCRLDIHNLDKIYNDIKKQGYDLKVILQSDKKLLKNEGADKLNFDIICDPEMKLYKAFDIVPAKNKIKMVGGKSVKKVLDSMKQGYKHGKYEGDELQLPCTLLCDNLGKISYVHYGTNIADVPTPNEILELLNK